MGKPVFILPGGPPSNLTAFLEIALPGLLALGGYADPFLPRMSVALDQDVVVTERDWTQFIYGVFRRVEERTYFSPLLLKSRLQSMAGAHGIICVPEGVSEIKQGTVLQAQMLS
jgi:molybdopterin molybdotransferase